MLDISQIEEHPNHSTHQHQGSDDINPDWQTLISMNSPFSLSLLLIF